MVLLPENNVFVGNVIIKSVKGLAIEMPEPDRTPPLDKFAFLPNRFEGNVVYGGEAVIDKRSKRDGIAFRDAEEAAFRGTMRKGKLLSPRDVGPAWIQ